MSLNTAKYVIEKAYVDASKLPRGGVPTPTQYLDGLDRLNDIINLEQTQGLRLWLEHEYELTLVASQQLYSFMPGGDAAMTRPMRVKQATYRGTSGNLRPLTMLSREEWSRLANRDQEGSVNSFFPEKLADRLNLHLWNVPDTSAAGGKVLVVLHKQATNPTYISEGTGFPPEWVIYLRWALAADLATGMPEAVIIRAQNNAAIAKAALDGWDVEDGSTYFQPSHQAAPPSRFA